MLTVNLKGGKTSLLTIMFMECFNDWGGGDTTIPSPGRSPKQPLSGTGLHDDPLHDRQACPELNSFHKGVCQISPREGLFSCRPLPKRGQICDIPAPPPIVERLHGVYRGFNMQRLVEYSRIIRLEDEGKGTKRTLNTTRKS